MNLLKSFTSFHHLRSINVPNHYHLIDCFRTFAALAVVLHHYQHFYYFNGFIDIENYVTIETMSMQPFYGSLYYFYEVGATGVQFFWVISGFIFASVYFLRDVSGKDFFVSRFARLYPLHIITLFLILFLQTFSNHIYGSYQIYEFNDLKHFILNLFFASSWGIQDGPSFNGPIWSVSVEILIYVVFFASQKNLFKFGLLIPLIFCILFLGLSFFNIMQTIGLSGNITACGFFFFSGSCIFHLNQVLKNYYNGALIFVISLIGGIFLTVFILNYLVISYMIYVIPFIVFFIVSIDNYNFNIFKKISSIGNLSYGIYLWHVPLQIFIILFLLKLSHANRLDILSSNLFFMLYIALLILISHLGFKYLENPLRKMINNRLKK
jgi:peptidoglycan/LPS O-acetylase OafA/YrhL